MSIVCLSLKITASLYAQSKYFAPTIAPRSPNTAAIEKFGSYEVNLFTGIPDISIPLYIIQSGDLKVPITLSYHSSGIKVNEVAGWVGLGWALSPGGTISRRIVGLADDGPYGYLSGYMKPESAYTTSTDAGLDNLENSSNGTYDTRPDIYSYDIPGHSGKFFLDGSDGSFAPRMIPFAPLKTNYKYDGTTLSVFNMVDEHGTRYQYGDANVDVTGTNVAGTHTVNSITGWHLNNMITQNKRDTVSFAYNDNSVFYPIADSESWTVTDQVFTAGDCPYTGSYANAPTTPGTNSLVQEKVLHYIYFKNGMVEFVPDDTPRSDINQNTSAIAHGLKMIKIYKFDFTSQSYVVLKTIQFFKSYFIDPAASNPSGTQRLRLDSLQVQDAVGKPIEHYNFDYNTSVKLPAYGSRSVDYWGYFNNKPNNYLTPQMSINYTPSTTGGTSTNVTIGSNIPHGRDCDSAYMQAYILNTIHYPTGGRTEFTYQTNQYLNNLGQLRLAGGLRIASVKSYDGVNTRPLTKTYQYTSADSNFVLNYCFFNTSLNHRWLGEGQANGYYIAGTEVTRNYVSNPRIDLEPFDAAPVKYSHVIEYNGTPVDNAGKTEYVYSFLSDLMQSASLTGGDPAVASYFFARGLLLHKYDYQHKANGTYQLVKEVNNTYTAFPMKNYANSGLIVRRIMYNEGPWASNPIYTNSFLPVRDDNSFVHAYYAIISDDNYLTSTSTVIHDLDDPNKIVTASVKYNYDNIIHQQVTRSYHTDSKGNTLITRSRYAADFLQTTTSTGNGVLDTMLNRNMQTDLIEKYDTLKNVRNHVSGIISGQLTNYSITKSLNGAVLPDRISSLNTAVPLNDYSPAVVSAGALANDARFVQMISFDEYGQRNNIARYTTRNSTPVAIIWDYNFASPVAQIKNLPPTTMAANVAYSSFETDAKGNWIYTGTPVYSSAAPTGQRIYSLVSPVTSPMLDINAAYTLAYWSNGVAATVAGSNTISGTPVRTVNGWTYYIHQIPQGTGQITLSGNVNVDELRLYPAIAQLESYTLDPLVGETTMTDSKGMPIYYTYDAYQRLYQVKDQYGNIVKQMCYNYAGNATNCAVPYQQPAPPVTCKGEGYKAINGTCVQGSKIYTSSVKNGTHGTTYICTYHYEWSDGSRSNDYTENHDGLCAI